MNGVVEKFHKYKKERKIIEAEVIGIKKLNFSSKEQQKMHKFAIVVPYRDNKHQNRAGQLRKFVPAMLKYLEDGMKRLGLDGKREFQIIVVEQSDDDRGFNRGQLLNVGFNLAKGAGFDYVIFHDVDLLGKSDRNGNRSGAEWYLWYPEKPVHIGGGWTDKYSYYTFVGGAFSISVSDNNKVGGFPNNFWGWGGEDDSFYNRMAGVGLEFIRPEKAFLEEMFHKPTNKIKELVMNKSEKMKKVMNNMDNGVRGWKKNGIWCLNKVVVNKRRVLKSDDGNEGGNEGGNDGGNEGAVLVNVTLQN